MSATSILCAQSLACSLGGRPILHDVSLADSPGEVLALVGPNGAGKSTLLRCLSGALKPQSGQVLLAGVSVYGADARWLAPRLAYMAQSPPPDVGFSAGEVVLLSRHGHPGGGRAGADRLAASAAIAAVGATALLSRPWGALSGGERQRLHLARALAKLERTPGDGVDASAPAALLLDEPVSSADLQVQHFVLQCVRQRAARGASVWLVLHDLSLALRYADRVAVLKEGRIVASGATREVLTAETISAVFGVQAEILEPRGQSAPAVWTGPLDSQ